MDPVEEQKCARNEIRSFIILDLETTGLPNDKPVKITEISMVAALREHIIGHGNYITKGVALPRVLSKVTVCVDPRKRISQTASDITHLTNDLLEHQGPFDEHLFNMLDVFMKRMPQPVCIIAHNGLKFDFPVLQAELFKIGKAFPEHIMCADSLRGFRKLLQASKSVEECNDKPTTIAPSSILNGIQPLNNHNLLEYRKATNQVCTQPNDKALEPGINELHLNDYDEALCAALEAAETLLVSESNKATAKVKVSDSIELEKKINPMENEVGVSQNILEKTPDRPVTVGGKYPNAGAGDNCAVTPKVETSEIIKGKRGHLKVSCQARKQLNFSSKGKPQNTSRSFKLDDVYRFILKRDPVNSHCAENDALNLLECIVALGHSFTEWADENAIQFNSIKKTA